MVKNSPANAGDARDMGSIPGSGRSLGGGNGNPLQYSCLANPIERSVMGYSPWSQKELDTTEHTCAHTHTRTHTLQCSTALGPNLESRMRQKFLPVRGNSMEN